MPEAEEIERVVPVIERLAQASGPDAPRVSIDTRKARVAEQALQAGARIVNDVSARSGTRRRSPAWSRRAGAHCCLMHMLGEPRTMQQDPRYDDVVSDVKAFLEERLAFAVGEGVPEESVWLDPGIGFGKTIDHNLELLRRLDEIVAIGRPVVIGTSRKSFIGKITGREETERLPGTIATNVIAWERGARIFRVHDVAPVADALKVAAATVPRRVDDDETTTLDAADEDDEEPAEPAVTVEITGLSLYTHHGVERGRARGRPAARLRPVVRGRRVRRDRHRPRRGHRRLRRRVPAGCARGTGTVVQDARATVLGDLRSDDRSLRRGDRHRPRDQA